MASISNWPHGCARTWIAAISRCPGTTRRAPGGKTLSKRRLSRLEESLALQIRVVKLPAPEREYQFAAAHVGPGRGVKKRLQDAGLKNWRFDFAWPDKKFAVEVEGGTYVGGRHNRGKGFEDDCIKYHHAMLLGWTVYRCTGRLVDNGWAVQLIQIMVGGRSES